MPDNANITIRDAAVADAALLVLVRRLMFEAMGYEDTARLDVADSAFLTYLEREMPAGHVSGWIAEDAATGGWVGGLANIWVDWPSSPYVDGEGRAYLFGLYVRPEYRRRGVARGLVQAATAAARERGVGAVMLHASDEGRPLYETLGFEPTSEMRLILKQVAGVERHA